MANNTGKKFGGRELGTPNQVTKEMKEKVSLFINENYDTFIEDFNSLDAKDRVNIYVKMLDRFLPKDMEGFQEMKGTTIIWGKESITI